MKDFLRLFTCLIDSFSYMKKKIRRKVEVVVLSDTHLGTYGCHAKDLLKYLKSIQPKILVLNGDIIDIWQFSKRYWPKTHMKVIKQIIGLSAKGTKTYYITGNHDEMLRKFEGLKMGNLEICNKLELELDGKKALIFHGDVFDVIMQNSKWLAKLGAIGYDSLIYLNTFINFISRKLGRGRVSLSKKIKDNVKSAMKYVGDFEVSAAEFAVKKGFSYIVCGHIHQAQKRYVITSNGGITYLNSGDWIENLTALEFNNGEWDIYIHAPETKVNGSHPEIEDSDLSIVDFDSKQIFSQMLKEFQN